MSFQPVSGHSQSIVVELKARVYKQHVGGGEHDVYVCYRFFNTSPYQSFPHQCSYRLRTRSQTNLGNSVSVSSRIPDFGVSGLVTTLKADRKRVFAELSQESREEREKRLKVLRDNNASRRAVEITKQREKRLGT